MPDNDSDAMHKQCHFKLAIVATVNFTMNYYTAILFFPHFCEYFFFLSISETAAKIKGSNCLSNIIAPLWGESTA